MTQIAIKQLIADISTATAKATKSKSAALKFLKEAGIGMDTSKSSSFSSRKAAKK